MLVDPMIRPFLSLPPKGQRIGSKYFYQLISNLFNMIYVNNFVNPGYKNIFIAFLLNEFILKNKIAIHFIQNMDKPMAFPINLVLFGTN